MYAESGGRGWQQQAQEQWLAVESRASSFEVPVKTLNHPQGKGREKDVARKTALPAPLQTASPHAPKPAHVQASLEMARPGLEPGTPRFSGTRRWAEKSQESAANRRVANRARGATTPVVSGGPGRG